jgi:hypothetical protein
MLKCKTSDNAVQTIVSSFSGANSSNTMNVMQHIDDALLSRLMQFVPAVLEIFVHGNLSSGISRIVTLVIDFVLDMTGWFPNAGAANAGAANAGAANAGAANAGAANAGAANAGAANAGAGARPAMQLPAIHQQHVPNMADLAQLLFNQPNQQANQQPNIANFAQILVGQLQAGAANAGAANAGAANAGAANAGAANAGVGAANAGFMQVIQAALGNNDLFQALQML